MGLAVVGALTMYAFHILFDAPEWGFIVALALFIGGMDASHRSRTGEQKGGSNSPVERGAETERLLAIRNPTAALAASIAAVFGIALGWLPRGVGDHELPVSSFVKVQKQHLLATASLKAALETVPSGKFVQLGGGKDTQFQAKMTFQNGSRSYCRQYELALGTGERVTGLACRIRLAQQRMSPMNTPLY